MTSGLRIQPDNSILQSWSVSNKTMILCHMEK